MASTFALMDSVAFEETWAAAVLFVVLVVFFNWIAGADA
jgi:hypothetical protein